MKCLREIFAILITISIMNAVRADILDIALPTMFGSSDKKYISCYNCINVTNSECNTIPTNSTQFLEVCDEGANGCVKKVYDDDGYTIMSRECYYGPVQFLDTLRCDGTKINYVQEKCFVCSANMCNSSTKIYSSSYIHYMWILSTILLIMRVPKVF